MADNKIDEYLEQVISRGDEGSSLLSKLTAPTLKNCHYVNIVSEGMNGVAVLKNLPKDSFAVTYSVGGDSNISDLVSYTESMVNRLVDISLDNGLTPLAFANVVDASIGERKDIETIGHALRRSADKYGIAVLNGELAVLGSRVRGIANINGTMISIGKKSELPYGLMNKRMLLFSKNISAYSAAFDHQGKAIGINSDGQGTKGEFQERIGKYYLGLMDSLAMKLDDTIKLGAQAMVVSDIIQTKGPIPISLMRSHADRLSKILGIIYIIQEEAADKRIRGYSKSSPTFNISGSAVSIIDEELLNNPPAPREGDSLVAVRGHPNPRSNGITDKRKTMVKLFGEDYQNTEAGKIFLDYLSSPSVIFYPHFRHLINNGLASSVYHMSGGAYKGKLAKPLAKHDLFASIDNLFSPDWRELALSGAAFTSAETAYSKWPMGTDGFVATGKPDAVISYLKSNRLEGRIVAQLKKRNDGKTGVELKAFNGDKLYFSGK